MKINPRRGAKRGALKYQSARRGAKRPKIGHNKLEFFFKFYRAFKDLSSVSNDDLCFYRIALEDHTDFIEFVKVRMFFPILNIIIET
jgi:hypothetical protein